MKDPKFKPVMLRYSRFNWSVNNEKNVQELLASSIKYILEKRKGGAKLDELSIGMANGLTAKLTQYETDELSKGFKIYVTASEDGVPSLVVDREMDDSAKRLTVTHDSPSGTDYVKGAAFAYIEGNHMVSCAISHQNHLELLGGFIQRLIASGSNNRSDFELVAVADIDKLALIKSQGVKKVDLKSSLYLASKFELDRQSNNTSFIHLIRNFLRDTLGKDDKGSSARENENLNVQMSIYFDGREAQLKENRKNPNFGVESKARLNELGELVLDTSEEYDGFTIETLDGVKITPEDIRVSETKRIKTKGNSLDHTDAWNKLREYFKRLKNKGIHSQ